MADLIDPKIRSRYEHVLSLWNCNGYIRWNRLSRTFIDDNYGEFTQKLLGELMWRYVCSEDGEIDQTRETREGYLEEEFHYDLRFEIDGRRVYIETTIELSEELDDCSITVVNMHYA